MTPEYLKNKYNMAVSLNSLKTYLTSIKKLGLTREDDLHKLMSPSWLKGAIDMIVEESKRSLNSACNHVFAITYFLKAIHGDSGAELCGKVYDDEQIQNILKNRKKCLMDNSWKGNEIYKDVDMSKLKDKWLASWLELEGTSALLDIEGPLNSGVKCELIQVLQKHFLVSMYIFNMPLRNDYQRLIYVKTNAGKVGDKWLEYNGNMLIDYGAHAEVVIRKFKTAKKYKEIKFKLSPESTAVFYAIKKIRKLKDGDDIIVNRYGTYYSTSTTKLVSDASKFLFDRDFSCNDYRHMYVINLLKSEKYQSLTVGEKMELANSMGHTYLTAQLYNRV